MPKAARLGKSAMRAAAGAGFVRFFDAFVALCVAQLQIRRKR